MAGRSLAAAGNGPWGRLNSHASGRRSGDQFCIYVCDRLVLPGLHNRLREVADGALSLDQQTRHFIRERLSFRVAAVATPDDARQLELALRRGDASVGRPMLNPFYPAKPML